jgi:2-oxoglutarate dehydrogenase E2 component (dihydrolipoamide succinyltransferase)
VEVVVVHLAALRLGLVMVPTNPAYRERELAHLVTDAEPRAVVVDDPELGEVIAVRSMVYLALTYDHRLVDGADAARFLSAVKQRLEDAKFEAELGM